MGYDFKTFKSLVRFPLALNTRKVGKISGEDTGEEGQEYWVQADGAQATDEQTEEFGNQSDCP